MNPRSLVDCAPQFLHSPTISPSVIRSEPRVFTWKAAALSRQRPLNYTRRILRAVRAKYRRWIAFPCGSKAEHAIILTAEYKCCSRHLVEPSSHPDWMNSFQDVACSVCLPRPCVLLSMAGRLHGEWYVRPFLSWGEPNA